MKAAEKLAQIQKRIEQQLSRNKDLDFLLKEIPEQIQKRTRLGRGVNESGAIYKFDPLSEKYIDRRKKSSLDPYTKPTRSNLTFTGQMLRSIEGVRRGTLFIFTLGGLRSDGKSNSDLAKWNEEKGRRFFDLSNSERLGLSRQISKILTKSIKKLFDN